jgi:aspartate racemase
MLAHTKQEDEVVFSAIRKREAGQQTELDAAALKHDGRCKVALLGTKPTMEFGFFQKHFAAAGIETLVPESPQRQELDRIVWEELSHGKVPSSSRDSARTMLKDLEQQGVEAVILGCTELSMLIEPADTPLPLYDTTRIHADAILDFALDRKTTKPTEPGK